MPADVAKFYGMIENIDTNFGTLLGKLAEWGIEKDTLVIFMTDNGTATGAKVFNAGMRGMKVTPYLGGTRVPAFWRWEGHFPAGVDVAPLTCHYDILPTLAELAGARIEGELATQVEGRSLVPLLRDAKAEWKNRYFVSHVGRWPKGKAEEWKYRNAAIRDNRWQLVFAGDKPAALYDLPADPGEKTDVADKNPEVVKKLRAEFDDWWTAAKLGMVNEDAVGPAVNPFHAAYWAQYQGPGPNNVPPKK